MNVDLVLSTPPDARRVAAGDASSVNVGGSKKDFYEKDQILTGFLDDLPA